jgi:isocitrate dehydrogenase
MVIAVSIAILAMIIAKLSTPLSTPPQVSYNKSVSNAVRSVNWTCREIYAQKIACIELLVPPSNGSEEVKVAQDAFNKNISIVRDAIHDVYVKHPDLRHCGIDHTGRRWSAVGPRHHYLRRRLQP